MSPIAVLMIKDNDIRVVNVRNQDPVMKLIDMVPGTVNKVSNLIKGHGSKEDPEVEAVVEETLNSDSVREEIKND